MKNYSGSFQDKQKEKRDVDYKLELADLPLLRLEYMIDDYEILVNSLPGEKDLNHDGDPREQQGEAA